MSMFVIKLKQTNLYHENQQSISMKRFACVIIIDFDQSVNIHGY